MDENVQQKITQTCIALLHKNVVKHQQTIANGSVGSACCALPLDASCAPKKPQTQKEAIAWLLNVANASDATFNEVTNALWTVYQRSRSPQTRQWITQLWLDLARREDITASDAINAAGNLCGSEFHDTQEQQEAIQILLAFANRRDIPFNDTVEAAHTLYTQSPKGSQGREFGAEMLLTQAHWTDITIAQAQEAALALASIRGKGILAKDWNRAIQVLVEQTQRPDLSFKDAVTLDDRGILVASNKRIIKQQLKGRLQMWKTVSQRSGLTIEEQATVAENIGHYTFHLTLK